MNPARRPTFISEAIKPVTATTDTHAMAAGAPGLPRTFIWRGQALHVADEIRNWRESGPCKHGSSESYVRKHWFEVKTTTGQIAMIYFERQARSRNKTQRWWLYTIEDQGDGEVRRNTSDQPDPLD